MRPVIVIECNVSVDRPDNERSNEFEPREVKREPSPEDETQVHVDSQRRHQCGQHEAIQGQQHVVALKTTIFRRSLTSAAQSTAYANIVVERAVVEE